MKSGLRWSKGAPNQVRFGWCGSVSELVKLTPHYTPLEAGLMSEIELINRAHADPEVRGLRRSSTRGGDESRHPSAAAAEEARRTTTGGNGEVGVTLQQSALVAFNDLSSAAGRSRALSEGLWGRAFLTALNSASDEERLRMVEGLGKGAGGLPNLRYQWPMLSSSRRPSSSASCPTTSVWKEQ